MPRRILGLLCGGPLPALRVGIVVVIAAAALAFAGSFGDWGSSAFLGASPVAAAKDKSVVVVSSCLQVAKRIQRCVEVEVSKVSYVAADPRVDRGSVTCTVTSTTETPLGPKAVVVEVECDSLAFTPISKPAK